MLSAARHTPDGGRGRLPNDSEFLKLKSTLLNNSGYMTAQVARHAEASLDIHLLGYSSFGIFSFGYSASGVGTVFGFWDIQLLGYSASGVFAFWDIQLMGYSVSVILRLSGIQLL